MTLSSGSGFAHAGSLGYIPPGTILADPFGPSPLVSDLSIKNPALFELASERGPAPTLFASGDLPPFTASGVDPEVLNRLPYSMRHEAASEPSAARVLEMVEQAAEDPSFWSRPAPGLNPGLDDYRYRMEEWTRGLKTPPLPLEEATYPDSWKTPSMIRAGKLQTNERHAR